MPNNLPGTGQEQSWDHGTKVCRDFWLESVQIAKFASPTGLPFLH